MSGTEAVTGFGLLRHGKTRWNRSKRLQGRSDLPLSGEGQRQVRGWIEILEKSRPWDRILSSSARRARQTAQIVADAMDLPIAIDLRLCEQDWGRWEGKTIKQIKVNHQQRSKPTVRPVGRDVRPEANPIWRFGSVPAGRWMTPDENGPRRRY